MTRKKPNARDGALYAHFAEAEDLTQLLHAIEVGLVLGGPRTIHDASMWLRSLRAAEEID